MGETCAVIFLGASRYDHHGAYTNPVFETSKNEFEDYLRSKEGLAVPTSRVLNLFNSPLDPGAQLRQIGNFAEQVRSKTPECERDLIVYYVGHGYFAGNDRHFYVALASMDQAVPDATGLRVSSLGDVLKPYAKSFRIYYLLDCCFAGEALKALQAGGEGPAVAAHKALTVEAPQAPARQRPRRGSALLCATSKDDFAMAPSDLGRTVFTDALLEALRDGDAELGQRLTLAQLAEVVWSRIRAKHRDTPDHQVRPVVHAPDQSEGDVSTHVELFPNPAWRDPEPVIGPLPTPESEPPRKPPATAAGPQPPPPPSVTPPVSDKRPPPPVPPTISTGKSSAKRPRWMRIVDRFVLAALLGGCVLMMTAPDPTAHDPTRCFANADTQVGGGSSGWGQPLKSQNGNQTSGSLLNAANSPCAGGPSSSLLPPADTHFGSETSGSLLQPAKDPKANHHSESLGHLLQFHSKH